ncbi:MAG: IclR family transcriptional regulator [Bacillota bacterium]|nr:IclR family transcriptional regulator [Bacillota bacterium]
MDKTKSAKKTGSQSTEKALHVLEYLADARVPVRLQDLAAAVGMAQPTLVRYLQTLVSMQYVYQEEDTLRYAITWKVRRLADWIDPITSLKNIVRPHLYALANRFEVGASLSVVKEQASLYLDFIDNPRRSLSLRRIGIDAPMHATGSGKLFLSRVSPDALPDYLGPNPLESLTEKTHTSHASLEAELVQIRAQGYAVDDCECEEGNRCIAVPVYDWRGEIIAAISVFDREEQMPQDRMLNEILPVLQEISRTVSHTLGCTD